MKKRKTRSNAPKIKSLTVRQEDSSGEEQYQFPKESFLIKKSSSAKQIWNKNS